MNRRRKLHQRCISSIIRIEPGLYVQTLFPIMGYTAKIPWRSILLLNLNHHRRLPSLVVKAISSNQTCNHGSYRSGSSDRRTYIQILV